jgi:hypothetical protein
VEDSNNSRATEYDIQQQGMLRDAQCSEWKVFIITRFLDFAPLLRPENTTFWKLDLFLSAFDKIPTLSGPIERINLSHGTIQYVKS